jgi:hypothetical protein
MHNIEAYDIKEIESFCSSALANVVLPKMQRGFVWKSAQMLNLWDSILRGFPIGALMLADAGHEKKELLDGQQRCTSIVTGFYNQFGEENNGLFSLRNFPSIWIDAKSKEIPIGNEYALNIVTKSHPWGYNTKNLGKVLSISDRTKSLDEYFHEKQVFTNYLEIEERYRTPWDTNYPVPLCFLLELWDCSKDEFGKKLLERLSRLHIKTKYSNNNEVSYAELENNHIDLLYEGLQNAKKLRIPEIKIAIEKINIDGDDEQDPTLFQRLNAGGTRLDGEELVYSIFKARFGSLKDLVEEVSVGFIPASKLINIFIRLARLRWDTLNEKKLNYIKPVSIRTFNLWLTDDQFGDVLYQIVNEAKLKFVDIFNLIKPYNSNEEIPGVLIKSLLSRNTDLVFVFMTYFETNKKSIEDLDEEERICLRWLFYNVSWFSREKDKVCNQIFEMIKENISLNSILIKLYESNMVLKILPDNILQKVYTVLIESKLNFHSDGFINKLLEEKIVNEFYDLHQIEEVKLFRDFVLRASFQRELIILAQRVYIQKEFKEYNDFYDIEDTNKPWDWDHIFPRSWAHGPHYIEIQVKQWINSTGNFRAMTLSDNRSENNRESPKDRLNDKAVREEFFIDEEDFLNFWSSMNRVPIHIKNVDDDNFRIYLSAILSRALKIYKNWYDNFKP